MGAKSRQQKAKKGPKSRMPKARRRTSTSHQNPGSGSSPANSDRMVTGTPVTPVVRFIPTGRALIDGRWVPARQLPDGYIEYCMDGEEVVVYYGAMLAPL